MSGFPWGQWDAWSPVSKPRKISHSFIDKMTFRIFLPNFFMSLAS